MQLSSNSSPTPNYRHVAQGFQFQLGIIAALFVVFIWSAWLIAVRYSSSSALQILDLALMRYAIPAFILFPFVWKARQQIKQTSKSYLVGITLGAGIPFFYLTATGLKLAPVVHAGLLIPGTFPVFVTLIAMVFFKEPINPKRLTGLAMILLGVLILLLPTLLNQQMSVLKGDLMLIGASACWAVYTVSMRLAGLPPLAATGVLCICSSLVLIPFSMFGILESGIAQVSSSEWMMQLVIQAIGAGLLAGFFYGFAINRLGAENTSAIGSLTPVVAGIAAIPILGEALSLAALIGMLSIFLGVMKASGLKLTKGDLVSKVRKSFSRDSLSS